MSNPGKADVITEIDDDRDGVADSGLRPVQQPRIRANDQAPPEDDFEVVETDDQGKPLDPLAGTVLDRGQGEGRMSEGEAGTRPAIEQDQDQGGERRPRERKADRNARRRESRDRVFNDNQRLLDQNAELAERLARLEGRVGETVEPRLLELGEGRIRDQQQRLTNSIDSANQQYRAATARVSQAMQAADTDAMTQALEDRDNALILRTRLNNEKEALDRQIAAAPAVRETRTGADQQQRQPDNGGQRQTAAPMPQRVQQFARAFTQEHDWYNPNDRRDVDSQTVLTIDNAVFADGFDPSSPDYWAEVQDRMKEKLPWRFEDDGQQDQSRQGGNGQQQQGRAPQRQQPAPIRRGPPTAGSSDRAAPGGGKRQVTISPDRKNAMIEAGAIASDGRVVDKNKYTRLLRSYDEFDRSNPRR